VSPHPDHREGERPDNHVFVLFGATGDLARRKILPGLFHLAHAGLMPERFRIIGSTLPRSAMTDEQFRDRAAEAISTFARCTPEGPVWERFAASLSFAAAGPGASDTLVDAVERAEREIGDSPRRLFHLSIPPSAMLDTIEMLGECGLNEGTRIICEKPFGTDFASARTLNRAILAHFDETQVFRIDHFLGKESIDNILAFRFANRLFEPLWNRDHVCYVQIDVPERIAIEGRAAFYEETGAFRDMVATHLLQVLGFLAMEQPISFAAGPVRDEVHKVFETMRPIDPADVVRGQYEGYRQEPGVAPDSSTETFVALRVEVENSRWKGVPFYLRTGKALAQARQVITIGFEEPVMRLFPMGKGAPEWRGNRIAFDFADPGSIRTRFLVKQPGPRMHLDEGAMTFNYQQSFQSANNLEAYEHLILEAMLGNRSLFTRSDGIERLWQVSAAVLENPPPVEAYPQGSWGPPSIERIVAPHEWCLPE
jgi:glucose-6-phosphate 1-dehydrogenase